MTRINQGTTRKMGTFYRFGDAAAGQVQAAFRTRTDLENFIRYAGGDSLPVYEIRGYIVTDSGGPDGLEVLVTSFTQLN